MLGTHNSRINGIFCWSIFSSDIDIKPCQVAVGMPFNGQPGDIRLHWTMTPCTCFKHNTRRAVLYSTSNSQILSNGRQPNFFKVLMKMLPRQLYATRDKFVGQAKHHGESWICSGQKNLITLYLRQFDRSAIH